MLVLIYDPSDRAALENACHDDEPINNAIGISIEKLYSPHILPLANSISKILQDIQTSRRPLEYESQVTFNEVEVCFDAMVKKLTVEVADSVLVTTIKHTISSELNKCYSVNQYTTAASLLDPLLHDVSELFPIDKRQQGVRLICKLLKEMPVSSSTVASPLVTSTPLLQSHRSQLFLAGHSSSPSTTQTEREYDYLAMDLTHLSPEIKPLHFWRSNKHQFPKLAVIA